MNNATLAVLFIENKKEYSLTAGPDYFRFVLFFN